MFNEPAWIKNLQTLKDVIKSGKYPATFDDLAATFHPSLAKQLKEKSGFRLKDWAIKQAVEAMTGSRKLAAQCRQSPVGQQQKSGGSAPAGPEFQFFSSLLPEIIHSAASIESLFPDKNLAQLTSGNSGRIVMSRQQAHAMLSAGFLGLLPRLGETFGELDFTGLCYTTHRTAVERVICQLNYFYYVQAQFGGPKNFPPKSGPIIFERYAIGTTAVPDWSSCKALLVDDLTPVGADDEEADATPQKEAETTTVVKASAEKKPPLPLAPSSTTTAGGNGAGSLALTVKVDDATTIEDAPGCDAQVDFANKQLMIGQLIPSMTQEEVMFSIRPECFLSLPLFDTLAPNEAVLMYGCKRYSNYSGYLDTFQVTSVHHDPGHHDYNTKHEPVIVAIDAIVNRGDQFEGPLLRRDLMKAFVGYHHTPKGCSIATGNWGCGAFRGDPYLKYLQQVMALAASNEAGSSKVGGEAEEYEVDDGSGSVPPKEVGTGGKKSFTYCTFRKPALAADLAKLTQALYEQRVTVAQAYKWLNEFGEILESGGGLGLYGGGRVVASVNDFLKSKLKE